VLSALLDHFILVLRLMNDKRHSFWSLTREHIYASFNNYYLIINKDEMIPRAVSGIKRQTERKQR